MALIFELVVGILKHYIHIKVMYDIVQVVSSESRLTCYSSVVFFAGVVCSTSLNHFLDFVQFQIGVLSSKFAVFAYGPIRSLKKNYAYTARIMTG